MVIVPVTENHGRDAHATRTPDGVTTNWGPSRQTKPIWPERPGMGADGRGRRGRNVQNEPNSAGLPRGKRAEQSQFAGAAMGDKCRQGKGLYGIGAGNLLQKQSQFRSFKLEVSSVKPERTQANSSLTSHSRRKTKPIRGVEIASSSPERLGPKDRCAIAPARRASQ
jgi:hypothetical protein